MDERAARVSQMSYSKRFVCLAAYVKPPDGRCIAGIELPLQDGRISWIRPVSDRPSGELSVLEYRYSSRSNPGLLDIIEAPLREPIPRRHQVENHLVDPYNWWVKCGELPWDQLRYLQERPATLWTNGLSSMTGVNDCVGPADWSSIDGSLFLIKASRFMIEAKLTGPDERRVYRGIFEYNKTAYNLSLTDPGGRAALDKINCGKCTLNDVFLCISLTQPFKDGRCYKLVAGLISNAPL